MIGKEVLCVLIGVGLFASCRKDVQIPDDTATNPPPPVAFLYHNPQPDCVVYSCDTVVGFIPQPLDTQFTFYYDVDADGTHDMYFTARNYYEFYSGSSPFLNYQTNIQLSAADSSIQFADEAGWQPLIELLNVNDTVQPEANRVWSYSGFVTYVVTAGPFAQSFFGDKFIAMRKCVSPGYYRYGWMRVSSFSSNFKLYIKDWALDSGYNQPIPAGDTL